MFDSGSNVAVERFFFDITRNSMFRRRLKWSLVESTYVDVDVDGCVRLDRVEVTLDAKSVIFFDLLGDVVVYWEDFRLGFRGIASGHFGWL